MLSDYFTDKSGRVTKGNKPNIKRESILNIIPLVYMVGQLL